MSHRYRYRRRHRGQFWIVIGLLLFAAGRCRDNSRSSNVGRVAEAPARDLSQIESALSAQAKPAESKEGVAAAIVIDVSGSMDDRVIDSNGRRARKIDVARRAARDLVAQFAAYAAEHADQPVSLGIYEFSRRDGQADCRPIIPMGAPDLSRADEALARLDPEGGTPIGQAMITAKLALDATGLSRRHLLLVTDGENTDGFRPDDVASVIAKQPESEKPSIYFVAFDIEARRFNGVREAGGLVLSAANAKELNETLDTLIRGKILVEK
jgi:Mg-chelatase subunit ChlD